MENSPYPRMAAALLVLLGLLDSIYLSLERLTGGALVCPVGGGCETVQSSAYALFLGVPVAYIGVVGYLMLLAIALVSLNIERIAGVPVSGILLALASGGLLFSLYLTYLQIAVIGAICFWCATSALLELAIWAAALVTHYTNPHSSVERTAKSAKSAKRESQSSRSSR